MFPNGSLVVEDHDMDREKRSRVLNRGLDKRQYGFSLEAKPTNRDGMVNKAKEINLSVNAWSYLSKSLGSLILSIIPFFLTKTPRNKLTTSFCNISIPLFPKEFS